MLTAACATSKTPLGTARWAWWEWWLDRKTRWVRDEVRQLDEGLFRTLAAVVREALSALPARVRDEEGDDPVRRTFQALRIEVNDELGALRTLLAALPSCLAPGGRVAILTFHSGEDRLVKKAFQAGARTGIYAGWSRDPVRPGPEELRANPRSRAAKLRWAVRAGTFGGTAS